MNEVNTTALLERVKRLERQNKLIKLTGIAVALGMAFVLCCGAKEKVPKEIVAESFRVVDTQGRTRALLTVGPEGPGLALFDEKEERRAALTIDPEGPGLGLFDERGKIRAALAISPESPALGLYDGKRIFPPRAMLFVDQEGPLLALFDENGKTVFSAP